MGLLDNTTQQIYYQGGDLGNYQFTSLDDIITQFQIAYVGEGKIIQKVKRADIAFHAQRGLQEFSFDTFKSVKSQEILLPASLQMMLPHDYVNYTKISTVDSAGVKHLLYPTTKTSNPFKIKQDADNNYDFLNSDGVVSDLLNADFSTSLTPSVNWSRTPASSNTNNPVGNTNLGNDVVAAVNGVLTFSTEAINYQGTITGRAYACWQPIDVSNMDLLDLKADGLSAAAQANFSSQGVVRVGISSTPGDSATNLIKTSNASTNDQITTGGTIGPNFLPVPGSLNGFAYVEWAEGTTVTATTTKSVNDIDVSSYDEVYVLVTSFVPMLEDLGGDDTLSPTTFTNIPTNTVDNIVVNFEGVSSNLLNDGDSTAWSNYKSATPSENQDDYEDDTYWKINGNRYGLDPQHAQANGSFYIEERLGKIHFSSNISGKTVILDYISDSLGTDDEMQVHKFAEEAMYKYIAYAILSTSSQPIHQQLAPRFKKERFAETRKAKLRLSNIKLEELTQILRGKSKQIKH